MKGAKRHKKATICILKPKIEGFILTDREFIDRLLVHLLQGRLPHKLLPLEFDDMSAGSETL